MKQLVVTQEELLNVLCLETCTLASRKLLFRKLSHGARIEAGELDVDTNVEREFGLSVSPGLERCDKALAIYASASAAMSVPSVKGYTRSRKRRIAERREHLL